MEKSAVSIEVVASETLKDISEKIDETSGHELVDSGVNFDLLGLIKLEMKIQINKRLLRGMAVVVTILVAPDLIPFVKAILMTI